MTPTARLSAAIEILDEIAGGRVADRTARHWAKSNRYAGSKDRAAIQARIFDVLRNQALYAHAMNADTPRALVMASLVIADSASSEDVAALFDGSRFAPEPLTAAEETALAEVDARTAEVSEQVRLNIPGWLYPELQNVFGASLAEEMTALNGRAPLDIRVNTLKGDRARTQSLLAEEGIETELMSLSPWGLRATGTARVTHTGLYKRGLVEIQDEGAQLACLVAAVKPGEHIVDLCAGAGGKALALAACLKGKGRIFACDTDPRRLGRLRPRMERAGAGTVETRKLEAFDTDAADPNLDDLEGRMDCVFVDAPCTGSGAWRRQPEARWQLTPEKLATYQASQAEVLARAARLLRVGGRLVYVTCSVLPSENDAQVDAFLNQFPQFGERDWHKNWPDDVPQPIVPEGPRFRLTPATSDTDGFFVSVLERQE
jgi:16S rRNA (cytosine967-C5)-methyltransferase